MKHSIIVKRTETIGNTLTSAVMTAFDLKNQKSVNFPLFLQHEGCGVVEVDSVPFDWFQTNDGYKFIPAQ